MVFQRIISRFPGRSKISGHFQRLCSLYCNPSVKFSNQSSKPLSQITQKRDLFSGISEKYHGPAPVLHNAIPRFMGNLGMKFGSLKLANSIHSVGQKEFERGIDNGPIETEKNSGIFEGSNRRLDDINWRQPPADTGRNTRYFEGLTRRLTDIDRTRAPIETGQYGRPFGRDFGLSESSRNMNFVRGIMRDNQNENYQSGVEQNADIVHIKIMRNNTFVTVTDSKGNKKMGASAGSLAEMKGGPKVSKYSAEATAEHVGRVAKSMGLKSVVMKVNGFTFFKKKKLAILSFRDGYTNSRSDRNPIVYIEDTTRKPHNGCRLKKQRRV